MSTNFKAYENPSIFHRWAAAQWRRPKDPPPSTARRKGHDDLVAKALAIAIARHPETNAKVRFWGKLEQRKTVDITVLLQARETDEERRVFWSELCRYSGWSGTLDSLVDHE